MKHLADLLCILCVGVVLFCVGGILVGELGVIEVKALSGAGFIAGGLGIFISGRSRR